MVSEILSAKSEGVKGHFEQFRSLEQHADGYILLARYDFLFSAL